jgi:hypothetical protein
VHDEDERQILVHFVNVIIATNLVRGLEFFCMSLMTGVIKRRETDVDGQTLGMVISG